MKEIQEPSLTVALHSLCYDSIVPFDNDTNQLR